ncbi:hypothetical protein BDF20DRAFT_817287 [Mycotypha africana]|uniref:uncharacterized protein n=1 Tax=Mycotypha africana TaxID=64632 RepID=UPI0023006BD6|nr:uncharacterized protein BDF20DRAFT_817287 [Mycotypha africana]KAI8981791.1 hypothetical protein BDF20DRAFT_817287 [Mycotypha africana]
MSTLDNLITKAIDDCDLKDSIYDLINAYPASQTVIERIIAFFENSEKDLKRRKIVDSRDTASNLLEPQDEVIRIVDLSFQLPNRKKYDLIFTRTSLFLHNAKTNITEFQYALADLSTEGGACVLTPDKATKNYTYTLFLKTDDCIVFNTQDKGDLIIKTPTSVETYTTDKHEQICKLITELAHIDVTQPSKSYFTSTGISASTGKVVADKHHVTAYHKNKEGFLFFLPTGILYGFKKPTLFFPISILASTVFTNITQRTFDMILILKPNCRILGSSGFKPTMEGEQESVAFSMLEQPEYDGINAYIKKLRINDQSMAEERKAPQNKQKQLDPIQNTKQIADDDEEMDDDFSPSESDDDPLEFDSDADIAEDDTEAT